jgi:DNA-directed RNA polymerase subunit RPC12/RpoP
LSQPRTLRISPSLWPQSGSGSVVKVFKCSSCGTPFLLDRAPQRPRQKPRCPACSNWVDAEPDDSLLKLLASPEQVEEMKEVEKLRAEVESLKPAEPFLDVPCAVCGKPLPNNYKRESVERFFKTSGVAHPECLKTPSGQLILLKMFHEALSSP